MTTRREREDAAYRARVTLVEREVDRVTESIEADPLCTRCKHPRAAHLCQPGGVQWICWRRGCTCANFQGEG